MGDKNYCWGYYKTNSYIYKIRSKWKEKENLSKMELHAMAIRFTIKCIDISPERLSRVPPKVGKREENVLSKRHKSLSYRWSLSANCSCGWQKGGGKKAPGTIK